MEKEEIDQTGIPTHECFNCGSNLFKIIATFEDYEIALYMVEANCAMCDSPLSAPTLPDHPFWDPEAKEITLPLPPVGD